MYSPMTQEDHESIVTIHYWYDRHTKSWVIQLKDQDNNQVGEAEYCGNREDRDYALQGFSWKYHLVPIKI